MKVALIIGAVAGVVVLAWGIDTLFRGGPCASPSVNDWQQLQIGMNEQEVENLLGKPCESQLSNNRQWWAYGYSYGLSDDSFSPHKKSHAVYFYQGKVTLFLGAGVDKPMSHP